MRLLRLAALLLVMRVALSLCGGGGRRTGPCSGAGVRLVRQLVAAESWVFFPEYWKMRCIARSRWRRGVAKCVRRWQRCPSLEEVLIPSTGSLLNQWRSCLFPTGAPVWPRHGSAAILPALHQVRGEELADELQAGESWDGGKRSTVGLFPADCSCSSCIASKHELCCCRYGCTSCTWRKTGTVMQVHLLMGACFIWAAYLLWPGGRR